jgi:hypothetical protein
MKDWNMESEHYKIIDYQDLYYMGNKNRRNELVFFFSIKNIFDINGEPRFPNNPSLQSIRRELFFDDNYATLYPLIQYIDHRFAPQFSCGKSSRLNRVLQFSNGNFRLGRIPRRGSNANESGSRVICDESGKIILACENERVVHKHKRQMIAIFCFIGCKLT